MIFLCRSTHYSNSQQNTFLVLDPPILHICGKNTKICICVYVCVYKTPLYVQSPCDLCEASSVDGLHEAPFVCAKAIGLGKVPSMHAKPFYVCKFPSKLYKAPSV